MKRIVLAIMILVPVIPFVLVLSVGYYYFTTSLESNTTSSLKRIVEDHRQMIESFLREREANLQFILYSHTFKDLSQPDKLRVVFSHLQEVSDTFVDLGVFDETGVHVAYQGPYDLKGRLYKEAEWFKEVIEEGRYISDVFLGYRRVPHFVIALAREEEGKKWVIRATIDTYLFSDLVRKVRTGKTGEAYILSATGILQTERRSGGTLMHADPDSLQYLAPHTGTKTFMGKDERGDEYLYATAWLKADKWLLVVRQERADAFAALRSATRLVFVIVIVGVSAIVGVAFHLTDRIVRRMERMDAEKERVDHQLIVAGRLAELGEMSAGFAHEINNPLQIIRAEQTLMKTIINELRQCGELKESEDLEELLDSNEQIKIQVDRCSRITQGILNFSRQEEPVSRTCDLPSFIPKVLELVEQKASVSGIAIEQEIADHIPLIQADVGQLQQVLLNFFNNAIDAIIVRHGSEGGELKVKARTSPNGRVEITVADNGCGISSENMEKIFTPFFTTKPVGKGTGLGLAICYGIIDKMGGSIEVSSEEGQGTAFTIRLLAAG